MGHATFTYEYYENEGTKSGLSNVANCIHSVDAYVLRCIHRRCNYDFEMVSKAAIYIEDELFKRTKGIEDPGFEVNEQVTYYIDQYRRSGMADVVILPLLTAEDMSSLDTVHLNALATIVKSMLEYQPFEVITIHDSFAAHANNINHLRQQYINVLAEMAESNLLDDLLSQLYGKPGKFNKLSTNLGALIRNSNYALS